MNYRDHYQRLIQKRKEQKIEDWEFFETHHIVPESEGGSSSEENLVRLTAREHFIAHWLLYRENPESKSRAFSFWRMCNGQGKVAVENWPKISSRAYSEGKEAFRESIRKALKGRKKTKEHVEKVAAANRGRKRTPEARKRMSEAAKNRPTAAGFYKMREKAKEHIERLKKPIQMLDKDSYEVLQVFESLKAAAIEVNRDSSNIHVAQKTGRISGGFRWKYVK